MGKAVGEGVQTALLLWVLVWKFSFLLWEGANVLEQPASLLYFNGGIRGIGLAAIISGLYLIYAVERKRLDRTLYIDSLLLALLGGYSLRTALMLLIDSGEIGVRGPVVLLAAASALIWLRYKPGPTLLSPVRRAAGLLAAYALVITLTGYVGEKSQAGVSASAEAEVGLKVGQQAPDWALEALDGSSVSLSSYRGRTVIVNFWATWCPPCRAEMPHLQTYHAAQADDGPVLLGINATTTEASVPVVASWIDSWKITFPILLDKEGTVTDNYGIHSYPTTYVIDGDGIIRFKQAGPMTVEMLEDAAAKAK
ncbi:MULTISPECIES: peroxiredoxin family protein [Paenibacillus]|uniref:peroxiredoxin family protein n=1 Tax=Paenibacillus TaxID=44249 RepID=UPI0022B87338|nr:TlpA disulfide reductase family protein [Paenibacillus caseinilyticus]MCZ8523230.1 TlpA disulfide reductase family protein [Paenibacillus caseinilyticus]